MSLVARREVIRFGTDGWRAIIAGDFTFENLERVVQAYADYLLEEALTKRTSPEGLIPGDIDVFVGYDRRFLSAEFARRASEVLAGNGLVPVLFSEPVPTPLVSWAVRELKASGGIVITASHNPAEFNGFKIKASWGGSASPDITSRVEELLLSTTVKRQSLNKVVPSESINVAVRSYRAQIEHYIDLDLIRSQDLKVIADPMHGSGGRWVESFLGGGAIKTETIRADRDPLFGGIDPEPIDRNLNSLKKRVVEAHAVIGLATDGDADRVGAVNELGATMTMHEVVPLLLLHLVRDRKMIGGVVRTFSQSVLIRRIAEAYNLPLYQTPIGFKYIAELMLSADILLGAEESGGIGVRGHIPERDGILNSLLLLEAVCASGKPPSEMVRDMHREFGEFYFGRKDVHLGVNEGKDPVLQLASSPPPRLGGDEVAGIETQDGTKFILPDESWLLFRQSGTEPVLRVYAEATSPAKVEALLDEGERLATLRN